MYYSKILMDLSRQEKNPVNKMYLSEISLKWKSFQQLTEGTSATNQELAEALSQFLASLHNRKFIFNKMRNTGFAADSPVFSPNYLYDLIAALMKRQPILMETGIKWDFQSFDYNLLLTGKSPTEIVASPDIRSNKTPPALSLTLCLDYQYRILGKRNFTKNTFVIPFLLFFAWKNPDYDDIFKLEHFALQAKSSCPTAQTLIICESLKACPDCHFDNFPFKIFSLQTEINDPDNQVSLEIVNKLEEAINLNLFSNFDAHLIQDKITPKKPVSTQPRKSKYQRKARYRKK